MIAVRKSADRGCVQLDWLDSRHSFSFGDYYDPRYMGWSDLRVINQDIVKPGTGFGTHGHKDMEILTYVLSGQVTHRDSLGSVGYIGPGQIQRMSAGTGIRHSEYNEDQNTPLELLQIWILPERTGLTPSYEEVDLAASTQGQLQKIGARQGGNGIVTIHQDVTLYRAVLGDGQQTVANLAPDRKAWMQVVRGELDMNGSSLAAGDGAAIAQEAQLVFKSHGESEFLLFDMRG